MSGASPGGVDPRLNLLKLLAAFAVVAVHTTMVVVVSPSKVTMLATMIVATQTLSGSPLAILMKKMHSGSNSPALSMMPK